MGLRRRAGVAAVIGPLSTWGRVRRALAELGVSGLGRLPAARDALVQIESSAGAPQSGQLCVTAVFRIAVPGRGEPESP